jgi:hypothetical protein
VPKEFKFNEKKQGCLQERQCQDLVRKKRPKEVKIDLVVVLGQKNTNNKENKAGKSNKVEMVQQPKASMPNKFMGRKANKKGEQ